MPKQVVLCLEIDYKSPNKRELLKPDVNLRTCGSIVAPSRHGGGKLRDKILHRGEEADHSIANNTLTEGAQSAGLVRIGKLFCTCASLIQEEHQPWLG